jgi:type IV secretion system protein VirB5
MEAKTKKWKPAGPLETPYKRAAQEWDNRMGNAIVQAKNWRMALFGTYLLIVAPLIFGCIYLGSLPKEVPHIVDVLPDGSAIYRGAVSKTWDNYVPEKASITYQLTRFLDDTRSISSDLAVVKKNWFDAYNIVTPKAATILSTYANENSPFERAKTQRVSIEQTAAPLQTSKDSWQVDWKETVWGPKGDVIAVEYWRASFIVALIKPKSDKDLLKNPLGIYIDEFHWAKVNR